jgi:hypothetical protein
LTHHLGIHPVREARRHDESSQTGGKTVAPQPRLVHWNGRKRLRRPSGRLTPRRRLPAREALDASGHVGGAKMPDGRGAVAPAEDHQDARPIPHR